MNSSFFFIRFYEKLLSLEKRDEVFNFECFEQQKENYLFQKRDKNFIRNNNTLEKASCKILAPVSFGEKHLLKKAEAFITKHLDILERYFPNSFEEYNEGIRKKRAPREIMDQKSF